MDLESALARTESDADLALKAAASVVSVMRKLRAAAKVGSLRELSRAIVDAQTALASLREQVDAVKRGWEFDEESYLSDGRFVRELLGSAKQCGVSMFELDGRLYCYPALLKVLPTERALTVDKAREKRLRPSVLARHLKDVQSKPVKFNSQALRASLASAYSTAVKTRGGRLQFGAMIPLAEIYELLTLLPGQSKEYSRHEFARDLYLLDESGAIDTRQGRMSLHTARGTESASKVFSTLTKRGAPKNYYGISFTRDG